MKIGIMGGTFDPIHNGHLMLGEAAYKQFGLDEVWFMPNGRPPHKQKDTIKSAICDRIEMVRLAVREYPHFRVEEYESVKEGVSYTYETLEYFCRQYPANHFYFIIGADSLYAIESWAHPERIFPVCTVLAAYRDEIDTKEEMYLLIEFLERKYHGDIRLLSTSLMEVSSSELRKLLEEKESISGMVPQAVAEYIQEHTLYQHCDDTGIIEGEKSV